MTSNDPHLRLAELSSATGVPTKFKIEWHILVADPYSDEKRLHSALSAYRVSSNREFFRCAPETALSFAKGICRAIALTGPITKGNDSYSKSVLDDFVGGILAIATLASLYFSSYYFTSLGWKLSLAAVGFILLVAITVAFSFAIWSAHRRL